MTNKLIFGARLYKDLRGLDNPRIDIYRLKGFRGIAYNDVIVFNHAFETKFDISKVYVKRCIGMPGDTISIIEGIYHNSSLKDNLLKIDYGLLANEKFVNTQLMKNTDISWTMINFGPLCIPRKGDTILLDKRTATLYARYMVYESGEELEFEDGQILLGGRQVISYTFEENYYFMAGENFADSQDSRYFGAVPETFIIGVVPRVLFAKDPYSGKINWKRIWKKL